MMDRQLKALKHAAEATGRKERIEKAIRVAGAFSSRQTDVGAQHDRHLAEAFGRWWKQTVAR
jgi:hypothetical protein